MSKQPKPRISFAVNLRTGFMEETVLQTLADGCISRKKTLIHPAELLLRMARELYRESGAMDAQQILIEAARMALRDDDNRLAAAGVVEALFKLVPGALPSAQRIIADTSPSEHTLALYGVNSFEALVAALRASLALLATCEWEHEESGIGRLVTTSARARWRRKHVQATADDVEPQPLSGEEPLLDIRTLCSAVGLDREETAYLANHKRAKIRDLPKLLSLETGEKWDAKRVQRVRKRVKGRWPAIQAAATKFLSSATGRGSAVLLRSHSGQATWTHKSLLDLFR